MQLTQVAQLAKRFKEQPELIPVLAEQDPKGVEEILRIAQAPFVSFQPYGSLEEPYTCQVAPSMSMARIRACVAGNRSGKTIFGLQEDVHDALNLDIITKGASRKYKGPVEIWVVSDTEETSINIAQRTLAEDVLGKDTSSVGWTFVDDKVKYNPRSGFSNNVCSFSNGSTIGFKFSSQGRNSFQGTKKHKVHLDESQPKDIYSECYARTIDYEGYMLITMTPIYDRIHGISWMYQDLYVPRKDKSIAFFNWSIFDNPYLSDKAKKDIISQWDEDELDVRAYGAFTPIGMRLAFKREVIRQQRERINLKNMATGFLELKNNKIQLKEVV